MTTQYPSSRAARPAVAFSLRSALAFALSLASSLLPVAVHAAPSVSVEKPPVVSGPNPNTGPFIDPTSFRGQWFITNAGAQSFRNNELYDNVSGQGGGALGSKAIHGIVTNIVYAAGPGSNIIGFTIRATIFNDTNTSVGAFQPGTNTHRESRSVQIRYVGPLYRPVMVTEFALNSAAQFPAGVVAGTPYVPSPGPRILAVNHDMRAWYCFNNTPAPVVGNYYVPAWQFPDIAVGASATLPLIFRVIDGGLTPADPRYAPVVNSLATGTDILSNRSVSLKLRSWLEGLWLDNGVAYFPSVHNSNAAVFHTAP